VAPLVKELHRRGIPVLLDGAHCLGQIPLDVASLGADWYVTNAHKWLYSPRGSALLYASDEVAPLTQPTVSSHYLPMGFPL
jgi:isopenicillin-N epimerase